MHAPDRRPRGKLAVEPDDMLEAYLAALDAALAGLALTTRREIVRETRSHVVEQTHRARPRAVGAVLAELGAPDAYARQFLTLDEPAVPAAAVGERGSVTLRGLAELTARGWRGLPLLLLCGGAYAVAGLVLFFVVGELVDPTNTGLFVAGPGDAQQFVSIVVSGDSPSGRDVLGSTLIPVGLGVIVVLHIAIRAILRRTLPREADHAS